MDEDFTDLGTMMTQMRSITKYADVVKKNRLKYSPVQHSLKGTPSFPTMPLDSLLQSQLRMLSITIGTCHVNEIFVFRKEHGMDAFV